MAPPSKWDDEDDSTPPSSPPTAAAIPRRSKFDDEEDDSDVLDSWDAAEDSEVEAEKTKKAAESKAKADAEAAANKKSKAQRIEDKRTATMRRKVEDEESSSEEDEADKRERLRRTEQESDLKHAEDLFGNIGLNKNRSTTKALVMADPADPTKSVDLSALPLFNPTTKEQFLKLRETLVPLLADNSKKAHYILFMQEFTKQIVKDLPSDQIKKISSGLATLSNEKMKEEKAADKGGKKSKAAKTKVTLSANRDVSTRADATLYDEGGLDDGDDFM